MSRQVVGSVVGVGVLVVVTAWSVVQIERSEDTKAIEDVVECVQQSVNRENRSHFSYDQAYNLGFRQTERNLQFLQTKFGRDEGRFLLRTIMCK